MRHSRTIGWIAAMTVALASGCEQETGTIDRNAVARHSDIADEAGVEAPLIDKLRHAKPAPNPPARRFTPETSGSADHRRPVARDLLLDTESIGKGVPLDDVVAPTIESPRAGQIPGWLDEDGEGGQTPEGMAETIPGGYMPIVATLSTPVEDVYDYPWASIVKLLMRFDVDGNDYYYVCSGFTSGSFHVVTAGHCIFNWDPNDDGDTSDADWADQVWVWAAQTDNNDPADYAEWPYSEAHSVALRSYTGWTQSQNLDHDWGVITLDRRLGDYTGWMGRHGDTAGSLNFSGYPAETPYVPAGNLLQYHGYDSGNVIQYTTYRIELDAYAYGGHSGCPAWYYDGSSRWAHGISSTSDRNGRADFTYLTDGKRTDLETFMSDDESQRAPTDRPDLVEYQFTDDAKDLLTNSVEQGGTIDVEFNTLNIGHANTGAITIDFYLSTNDSISESDEHIGSATHAGLDAATYIYSTITLTVPEDLDAGDYYVGWITSCDEQEYARTSLYDQYYYYMDDRAAVHDETVTVVEAAQSDLVVTDLIVADSEFAPGDAIDLEWDDRNDGGADAGAYSYSIRMSTNDIISESDTEVCSGTMAGLQAGQASTHLVTCTVPQIDDGAYYVGVILDREDAIEEEDESNNTGHDPSPITIDSVFSCIADGALSCPNSSDSWSNDGAGSTDDIDTYACNAWDYEGPEYTYEFTAIADGEVTVSLSGLSADLDLLLLEGASCDPNTCIADSTEYDLAPEELTFQAAAGTTYRIVVDGYAGAVSNFDITLDCGAGLVFEDDFESGDLAAWNLAVTQGTDLRPHAVAAIDGSFGLLVTIDDPRPRFLLDDSPEDETELHARFWIDANSVNMASGDSHTILDAQDALGGRQFRLLLEYRERYGIGRYQVVLLVREDGGSWRFIGNATFNDAPTSLEVDWLAASAPGMSDGLATLYVNGVQEASVANLDNDQGSIDRVRLGPSEGIDPGTQGVYFIDEFVMQRDGHVGP